VLNQAGVCNLTAFHGIYPRIESQGFAAALVACLNSRTVQALARQLLRVYGGGLLKVEPRDLLDLPVPDLARVGRRTIGRLERLLAERDHAVRAGRPIDVLEDELDKAVLAAGAEAAASCARLGEQILDKRRADGGTAAAPGEKS
jgi:adenine-specific DNA-methyltransferase